jgi:hypothetical protein
MSRLAKYNLQLQEPDSPGPEPLTAMNCSNSGNVVKNHYQFGPTNPSAFKLL